MDESFDLNALDQPNIDDIADIEVEVPPLEIGNIERYVPIEEINNNENDIVVEDISLARLVEENDGSDNDFWKEFLRNLKGNHYMGDYSFFESRQERLITLMLSDPEKAEDFIAIAKSNESMKSISLDISFRFDNGSISNHMGTDEYYRRWKIIGTGIGNLRGLKEVQVNAGGFLHNHNHPDFEALAIVLQGITQLEKMVIKLDLFHRDEIKFTKELRNLKELKEIQFKGYTEPEPMEAFAEELLDVPNLAKFQIDNCYNRRIPCRNLPDRIFALFDKPELTKICLQRCILSQHQCELLVDKLETTKATTLDFQYSRFRGNGGELLMTALAKNAQVGEVVFSTPSLNMDLCKTLAKTILVNTSIHSLTLMAEEIEWSPDGNNFDTACYGPIFISLRSNTTLRFLNIGELEKWSKELAELFRSTMESPTSSVEELLLVSRGDASEVWQWIAPFLKANRTLKSLTLAAAVGHDGVLAAASYLAHNKSLETFEAFPCSRFEYEHSLDDHHHNDDSTLGVNYLTARTVEALGKNDTLQKLYVDSCLTHRSKDTSDEGTWQLIKALCGNYGLQTNELAWQRDHTLKKPIEAIVRLNGAGRRYLLDEPTNKSRCVAVLGQVTDNIDAMFMHLQENPVIF